MSHAFTPSPPKPRRELGRSDRYRSEQHDGHRRHQRVVESLHQFERVGLNDDPEIYENLHDLLVDKL